MATTTTPDNIYVLESSDPDEPLAWQPAMATSVQNALNSRAIRTFKWANATERSAQTGMTEGDYGDQADNATLYRYDGSAWVSTKLDQSLIVSDTANFPIGSSLTKITDWATEERKEGGAPSLVSGTFTATRAGWYSVTSWAHLGTSGSTILQILSNSVVVAQSTGPSDSTYGNIRNVAADVYLSAGGTVEIWAARSSGTNITSRRWSIRRIGD